MNKLLALTAVGEAFLGMVLLVSPPVVVRLLFGAEISGAGMVMGRITGISLIALGVACWPGNGTARTVWGMVTYSALVTRRSTGSLLSWRQGVRRQARR